MPNIASKDKVRQRRQSILSASLEIFAQKGYHDTNISDIASHLRIGHGTIYRYFKNKRDIFVAVINEILMKLSIVVSSEPPKAKTLNEYREQLERIGDQLIELFHEDPRLAQILFYESMGVDRETIHIVQEMHRLFASFTEAYLKHGQQSGFLDTNLDMSIGSKIVTGMFFEAVKVLATEKTKEEDLSKWRDNIIHIMIFGLKS